MKLLARTSILATLIATALVTRSAEGEMDKWHGSICRAQSPAGNAAIWYNEFGAYNDSATSGYSMMCPIRFACGGTGGTGCYVGSTYARVYVYDRSATDSVVVENCDVDYRGLSKVCSSNQTTLNGVYGDELSLSATAFSSYAFSYLQVWLPAKTPAYGVSHATSIVKDVP